MKRAAVIGCTSCIKEDLILTPLWQDFDILLINYLTCDMLVESSLGFDTPIIRCIKKNIPVYVSKNGLEYKKYSNTAISNVYASHKNNLIALGVKFINFTERQIQLKTSKKLINLEVISAWEQGFLEVDSHCILTPSAEDYAKEHNIKIIRNNQE